MLIDHPLLGPRDAREFVYLGDAALIGRPDPDAFATRAEAVDAFVDWLYLRDNPAGWHEELWFHEQGDRSWLVVTRDTTTHEIHGVRLARDVALERGRENGGRAQALERGRAIEGRGQALERDREDGERGQARESGGGNAGEGRTRERGHGGDGPERTSEHDRANGERGQSRVRGGEDAAERDSGEVSDGSQPNAPEPPR